MSGTQAIFFTFKPNQHILIAFDDRDLVRRLQNDEIAAFDTLYGQYHAAIYSNVMKLVKNEALTEDIVQEVFISLWEKRNSLDKDRSVGGWLFVVSYNRSITELKKILQHATAEKALQYPTPASDEDLNIADAQWAVMEKAIEQLSPQQKRVFQSCKLQGKTYEQTANEMDISKHTVKEYLSAAVASIKKYIQQHPEQVIFIIGNSMLIYFLL